MTDDRDIPDDTGRAPPFAKSEPRLGPVGTGDGYSGQEYDGDGQAAWREGDRRLGVSPDGAAHGTGSPREEFDPETSGGAPLPSDGRDRDDSPPQR